MPIGKWLCSCVQAFPPTQVDLDDFHLFHTDVTSRQIEQGPTEQWSSASDVSSSFEHVITDQQPDNTGGAYNLAQSRAAVQLAHATGCTVCVILWRHHTGMFWVRCLDVLLYLLWIMYCNGARSNTVQNSHGVDVQRLRTIYRWVFKVFAAFVLHLQLVWIRLNISVSCKLCD